MRSDQACKQMKKEPDARKTVHPGRVDGALNASIDPCVWRNRTIEGGHSDAGASERILIDCSTGRMKILPSPG